MTCCGPRIPERTDGPRMLSDMHTCDEVAAACLDMYERCYREMGGDFRICVHDHSEHYPRNPLFFCLVTGEYEERHRRPYYFIGSYGVHMDHLYDVYLLLREFWTYIPHLRVTAQGEA